MSEQDQTAEQALQELLSPITELDGKLAQREAHLINELEEIRGERRKLRGVLRAVQADPKDLRKTVTQPKPKGGGGNNWTVSAEKVAQVLVAASGYEGEFASGDLVKLLAGRVSNETVRRALQAMRDQGLARLIRQGTGKPGETSIYVITPKGRDEAGRLAQTEQYAQYALNGSEPS